MERRSTLAEGVRSGPLDASMGLLNTVMSRPLDPGYEAAARRRAAHGPPVRGVARVAELVLLGVLLGAVTIVGILTLRAPQPAIVQARAVLEEEITTRSGEVAALDEQRRQLESDVVALQEEALRAANPALLAQLAVDEQAAAAQPVTGPGMRITLADAASATTADALVHDADLRTVVNGLWAAGAEAIAVGGIRLDALTAIRSAGGAVLVGLTPLPGPYVVEAIGDPDRMPSRFARTPAGEHLAVLRTAYGITAQVDSVDTLTLPGSRSTGLRAAQPALTAEREPEQTTAPTGEDPL